MWRPKNWAQLLLKHTRRKLDESHPEHTSIEGGMLFCAEAGADAMLEALKAKGINLRVIEQEMADDDLDTE